MNINEYQDELQSLQRTFNQIQQLENSRNKTKRQQNEEKAIKSLRTNFEIQQQKLT